MQKIEYSEFAPSFSCYTSNSITSNVVSKVIHEEDAARSKDLYDDFEFSLVLIEEEVSEKDIDSLSMSSLTRTLLVNDEVDSGSMSLLTSTTRTVLVNDDVDSGSMSSSLTRTKTILVNDDVDSRSMSSSLTRPTRTPLVNDEVDREIISSSSCSSSEADELERARSGAYCAWTKAVIAKCEKSKSTGSGTGTGSKKWRLRYLLRRSNSEGKEPMMLLNPKKVDSPKQQKPNSRRVSGEGWKAQSPVHEQFYVQRRAENEVGKRRSYLPYRTDLVGLFASVNGIGKMLPF